MSELREKVGTPAACAWRRI